MEPIDVVLNLKKAKKSEERLSILDNAWSAECFNFFEGVFLSLNPLINLNLKKIPKIIEEDDEPDELGFIEFRRIVTGIYHKKILNADKHIKDSLNMSSVVAWNEWYRRILLKDLHKLITVAQFNKFLMSKNEEDLLIPVFKFQKAQSSWSNFHKYSGNKFLVDPYISGDRLLVVAKKSPPTIMFFDAKGKKTIYHDLEDFENLLELLPIDVIFDGVYSEGRYYIFDLMPLKDYLSNNVEIPLSKRHRALCDLQDVFVNVLGSKIRILPKKMSMISSRSDIEKLFNEFVVEQGYEGVVFKRANSGYQPGKSTTNWLYKFS